MIKIVVIFVLFGIIIVYLRSINSEFSSIITVAVGVIASIYAFQYLISTIEFVNKIVELTKIDPNLYVILFKITGIGYLIEFGAGTLKDMGLNGLSDKVIMVGKFIILSVSLPILYAVFNLISGLLA